MLSAGDLDSRLYFGGIAAVLGLAFALIEPTRPDAALVEYCIHLLQWQLQTLAPMALLVLVQSGLERSSHFRIRNPWVRLLGTALAASLLFAPMALLMDVVWRDEPATPGQLIDEWLSITPTISILWLTINAPFVLGLQWRQRPESTAGPATPAQPAVAQALPESLRGELVHLEAELHYLGVTTVHGRTLILYNLRDAIAGLPDHLGMQVHRSHWVAWAHVDRIERNGRQGTMVLRSGQRIPVARSRLAQVEQAAFAAAQRRQ